MAIVGSVSEDVVKVQTSAVIDGSKPVGCNFLFVCRQAGSRCAECAAGSGLSGVGQVCTYKGLVPMADLAGHGHDQAYNTISGIRGYDVITMLTLEDPKATRHTGHTLSNRNHCRIIARRYYGDLSTVFNYTCLLVAFRDAVVGKPIA